MLKAAVLTGRKSCIGFLYLRFVSKTERIKRRTTFDEAMIMYDLEKIHILVSEKRKRAIVRMAAVFAIMVIGIIICAVNFNDTATLIGVLAQPFGVILLFWIFKRYNGKILFSKEIRGTNIKEHEYGIQGDGQPRIYRRGNMPHNFSNRKDPPRRINGNVYVRLDDGNVREISGVYKSHLDIYEDGDMLLKPAGTRFPVVINRAPHRQPCPICGEVNDMSENACRSCGLNITPCGGTEFS